MFLSILIVISISSISSSLMLLQECKKFSICLLYEYIKLFVTTNINKFYLNMSIIMKYLYI